MIETTRLTIVDRQLKDIPAEEYYGAIYPETRILDPIVGESRNPVFYSMFVRETGIHIGTCSLYNFTHTEVELGVRIFIPEYWNRGYGSEVVDALCIDVFNHFPQVTAVLAKTPAYNIRAIRCYEKCGFVRYSQAVLDGYDMVFMVRPREANL